jgi:methionyl-tRNA formyltransferase
MDELSATADVNSLNDLSQLRIVFMGTPEFAVASLDALYNAGCNIVGVVTAPDKPAGRGLKLNESSVKKYAREHNLHILQPEKLKNNEFISKLRELKADLQIIVAFRMLPEIVWSMPPLGTVNLHASLLPDYRGAAPINWAIINGEKTTGVTTFRLQHEIDTGNVLMQEAISIGPEETAGALHDRMKDIGAKLILKTVEGIANNTLKEVPQEELINETVPQEYRVIKHAPKITTETCSIKWEKTVTEVHNLIRGLSPYPAAFTKLDGKILKIYSANKEENAVTIPPGTYITDQRAHLKFACADGYIDCKEVQLEGKKMMMIEDFLRGYRFAER